MNEFYRISDEFYTLNSFVKVKFNVSLNREINNQMCSFYSEYKTNNKKEGCVLISRKLNYFLTLEYSYKGDKNSIMIYPEHMIPLLQKMAHMMTEWFTITGSTFGLVNGRLTVVNQYDTVLLEFPQEKILRMDPIVLEKDNGTEVAGIKMYIGDSSFPIDITSERFSGLYYLLSNLDMMTYANTSLAFIGKPNEPYNRISFTDEETGVDKSTILGKAGRDFAYKKGFF